MSVSMRWLLLLDFAISKLFFFWNKPSLGLKGEHERKAGSMVKVSTRLGQRWGTGNNGEEDHHRRYNSTHTHTLTHTNIQTRTLPSWASSNLSRQILKIDSVTTTISLLTWTLPITKSTTLLYPKIFTFIESRIQNLRSQTSQIWTSQLVKHIKVISIDSYHKSLNMTLIL